MRSMSELRKDPIVGRWVIIAKNRADRPQNLFDAALPVLADSECPFCEGNESQTPSEICAARSGQRARPSRLAIAGRAE